MPTDAQTFLAAFAAIALAIAAYLWHLERRGNALAARLATLEAAAKEKNPPGEAARRP